MSNYYEAAKSRLKQEYNELKNDNRYINAVKLPVMQSLIKFCEQDDEFAQAVAEPGSKSFAGCLSAVVKGCGNVLSDVEAYRRAASYYFDGAYVEMQMVIHVNPHDAESTTHVIKTETKVISLLDLL